MGEGRRAKAVAVALITIALAGCGPFSGKSEQDKAGDTVTQLIEARNKGDFVKVCSLIASQQLAKFKQAGTTCEQALPKLARKGTTTAINIAQVRVSGDRATVDATVSQNGGAGNAQTILLVKEGADWKVSQVGF